VTGVRKGLLHAAWLTEAAMARYQRSRGVWRSLGDVRGWPGAARCGQTSGHAVRWGQISPATDDPTNIKWAEQAPSQWGQINLS